MKCIIAGSRDFDNTFLFLKALDGCPWLNEITEVVSGGCRGTDEMGEMWATDMNIPIRRVIANWKKHGRSAGPIRNSQMAVYSDALIAIWDGISSGTKSMIESAQLHGLRVYVYRIDKVTT